MKNTIVFEKFLQILSKPSFLQFYFNDVYLKIKKGKRDLEPYNTNINRI